MGLESFCGLSLIDRIHRVLAANAVFISSSMQFSMAYSIFAALLIVLTMPQYGSATCFSDSDCRYNQFCNPQGATKTCTDCNGCAKCGNNNADFCIACVNVHTGESNPWRSEIEKAGDSNLFALSNALDFTFLYEHECFRDFDCPAGTYANTLLGTCSVLTICGPGEVESKAPTSRADRECIAGGNTTTKSTENKAATLLPSVGDTDWLLWLIIALAIVLAIVLLCCFYRRCCSCCAAKNDDGTVAYRWLIFNL